MRIALPCAGEAGHPNSEAANPALPRACWLLQQSSARIPAAHVSMRVKVFHENDSKRATFGSDLNLPECCKPDISLANTGRKAWEAAKLGRLFGECTRCEAH